MNDIDDIMGELNAFIINEVNDLQEELYKNIKRDNPRDTGYSARRWKNEKFITRVGEQGILSNDAHYIGFLEMGWSKQAPNGFVLKNIIQSLNRRR